MEHVLSPLLRRSGDQRSRAAQLRRAAGVVASVSARGIVAVDGIDAAGKTTFADMLAPLLRRPVVRASIDDFHNPRAVRYRRGRDSPEGYLHDSFDLDALRGMLLEPFAAGRPFRRRFFDFRADARAVTVDEIAPPGAVLLLDGVFLHRDELHAHWAASILLDVPPRVAAARFRERDGQDVAPRYVRGQELYFATRDPRSRATLVLDW